MKEKTPLQKASADYYNNQYWFPQLLALAFIIVGIVRIEDFYETFSMVLWFLIPSLVILIPFIFMFIWAYQYKKGTRK